MASSNALTARMQKQMERRAAKQAAKKAALQTSDGVRRIQKTARKLNAVEDGAGNCIVSVRDIGYKFELNKENEQQ